MHLKIADGITQYRTSYRFFTFPQSLADIFYLVHVFTFFNIGQMKIRNFCGFPLQDYFSLWSRYASPTYQKCLQGLGSIHIKNHFGLIIFVTRKSARYWYFSQYNGENRFNFFRASLQYHLGSFTLCLVISFKVIRKVEWEN